MDVSVLGHTVPPFTSRLENVRLAWGAVELASPGMLASLVRLGRPLDRSERMVIRVLGVRQVGQGVASQLRPSAETTRLGLRVDLLHAASMVGLAIISRRHRRLALASAGIAGGLAGAAWLSLPAQDG